MRLRRVTRDRYAGGSARADTFNRGPGGRAKPNKGIDIDPPLDDTPGRSDRAGLRYNF